MTKANRKIYQEDLPPLIKEAVLAIPGATQVEIGHWINENRPLLYGKIDPYGNTIGRALDRMVEVKELKQDGRRYWCVGMSDVVAHTPNDVATERWQDKSYAAYRGALGTIANAQNHVGALNTKAVDHRSRRQLGKSKQFLLRMTPERYRLLLSLADLMGEGRLERIPLTAVVEAAIDALDAKLNGGRKEAAE